MQATLADSTLLQTEISVNEFGTSVAFTLDFCWNRFYGCDFITVDPFIFNPGVQVCDWEAAKEVDNPSNRWFVGIN